ncbi:MAG: hypothetical protein ABIF18_02275 [archaeon]
MKNKKVRFNNLSCFPQRNFRKKAQIFSLILVAITLFMCISSGYIYIIQQGNAESSLVSPLVVLEVRDNLTIFEMREKALVKKSLEEVGVEFGSEEFPDKFRDNFLDGLDSEMKNFIFENLMWEGKKKNINFESDEGNTFLSYIVYPEIEEDDDDEFVFVRNKIGKSISLSAEDKIEVNFPVDFLFEFEREYLISKKNGKFEVSVV